MSFTILSNLTNATTGLEGVPIALNSQLPNIMTGILVFIWAVITLGGYISEEQRKGKANFAGWGSIGGLIVGFVAIILTFIPGLMSLTNLFAIMSIEFLLVMWFLFTNDDF